MNTAVSFEKIRLGASKKYVFSSFHLVFPILITLLVSVFLTISLVSFENARNHSVNTRLALAKPLREHIRVCAGLGRRMTYAGADIQFTLYPEIKPYLYMVIELNQVCYDAFGKEYSPIDQSIIKKVQSTCTSLERNYASGRDAKQDEAALTGYLAYFSKILSNRFTDDGDIIPLSRQTPLP